MQDKKVFETRYKKLNKAQKQAVDTVEGPVLVVAGPGSGKTEILSLRVGQILKKTDVAPSNILCLTFTDSAAQNMRERLSKLIGAEAYRVAIHTFHSFGVEVIDKNPEFFYNGAHFIPADDLMQLSIIEGMLEDTDHDNPLNSRHPSQGYVYAKPIKQAIAYLKKAGLTPDEFKSVLDHNKKEIKKANTLLAEVFDERLSKKSFSVVQKAIEKLREHTSESFPVPHLTAWTPAVASSLEHALKKAQDDDKATALSAWKTKYTKKDDDGKRVHRDWIGFEKMYALSDMYARYREHMYEEGFYDFDDMILETIQAIEKNNRLRYDLQEQFQYILVDEFQDTNDAQVRLLHLISDAQVHEGKPNVMVVGDDDQAIYKFQGAELSNILYFKDTYREPEIVTMINNYRSTQDILDVARLIIQKGDERLENMIEDMSKELKASNAEIAKGSITHLMFETNVHEGYYLAEEVEKLIKKGKNPEDIAVISRTHKRLEQLVPYFHARGIPISYERKQNVLQEPHIRQLIVLGQYISSLARKNAEDADHLLPEILSFPFWRLDRATIWEIAIKAEHSGWPRKQWLGIMRESGNKQIRDIAHFFDELTKLARTDTLETVLDAMVGAHVELVADDEYSDDIKEGNVKKEEKYESPFKSYYFNFNEFEKHKATYLNFLSSLRVFIHALREYKGKERLNLDDMVEFVDLHDKNKLQVTDTSPFVNAKDAVHIMTAHKSKGLEFNTVFVASCQNDIWAGRQKSSVLSFPENLAITPAGDTHDDQLKLFYVAVTRARSSVYLTSYRKTSEGKDSARLYFLDDVLEPKDHKDAKLPEAADVLVHTNTFYTPPFVGDEKAQLETLLENYQMPVTHLNNFLDVSRGGPQTFLEQNLLRFPQSMGPAAAYGSSMHKAIELLYTHLRKDGLVPALKTILEWFERELYMKRLSDTDNKQYLKRGIDALTVYYSERLSTFDPSHFIELNFKNQGVMIGDAHITGKIDKMIPLGGGEYEVVDFKTGHAVDKWLGKTPYEKIKLHNYKRQIIFYKLLVEHSRDFADSAVVEKGRLEFLEPKNKKIIDLSLDIEEQDVERAMQLIEVVYEKIMNLDFPDVSEYSQDIKGIIEFEEYLLGQ